jgi:hypothetical protein
MRSIGTCVVVVLLLAQVCAGQIYYPAATTTVLLPGARAAALGGSYTALVDDASAIAWNPGALALAREGISVVGTHSALWPDEEGANHWFAAASTPIGNTFTVAGAFSYIGRDEELRLLAPDDPVPFVSFTHRYTESTPRLAGAVLLWDHLGVGMSAGRVALSHDWGGFMDFPEQSGSGMMTSFGALYSMPLSAGDSPAEFRLGVTVLHMGDSIQEDLSTLRVESAVATELEDQLHVGASGRYGGGGSPVAALSVEHVRSLVREENDSLSFGLELLFPLSTRVDLAARTGYVREYESQDEELTYGGGIGATFGGVRASFDLANVPVAEGAPRLWKSEIGLGVEL